MNAFYSKVQLLINQQVREIMSEFKTRFKNLLLKY